MTKGEGIEKLKLVKGQLSTRDQEFANSLLKQFHSKGHLSEKQWPWIEKLVERAEQPVVEDNERKTTEVGSFDGLHKLFAKAQESKLKWPAITLAVPGVGMVRLSVAGPNAKKPGSINVVSHCEDLEDGSRQRVWFGRVVGDTFEHSFKHESPQILIDFLKKLAGNPAQVASDHGHLTGRCCFCHLHLSDERSARVGYGKKCASNYGLPWGKQKADAQFFAEAV